MKYTKVKLGNEYVDAARIAMGTMNFGSSVAEETAFEMMDYYLSIGGNWYDTAHMYAAWEPDGLGKSEITLGKWIKARNIRDKIFVSTKGGFEYGESSLFESNDIPRLEHDYIIAQCDDSLKRLQLDYVDVYFLHTDDPTKPVSDIMDFMDEIVKSGRARAIGASNWSTERIHEANVYARAHGKTEFTISQINWSVGYLELHDRLPADEMTMSHGEYEYYTHHDMPVMGFASQARGIFSKGIAAGCSFEGMKNDMDRIRYFNDRNYRRMLKVKEICDRDGVSPSAVVVNYLASNKLPGISIVGASSMAQLRDSLSAADYTLPQEDIEAIDNIVM